MKKMLLLIIIVILTITIASCFGGCTNASILRENNAEIADETFREIIEAIRLKNGSKIVDLFSSSIKSEESLSVSASKFIDYIQGEIISFSSASESGVGASYKAERGKKKKEIQASFTIVTSESKYYLAIKECTRDDFDENNIGIISIYIIEADNWTVDYVYGGDGQWTPGIHIH